MTLIPTTPLRECIELLKDRHWHDVYELHSRYRLTVLEVLDVVNELMKLGLLEKIGSSIRLAPALTNAQFAVLNRIQKTTRPPGLDQYHRPT
jgi:hypothetical protein